MKKILGFLLGLTLLTGCAESLALLGPTSTAVTGGNIAQSALSSAVNYGVKKQTGKSPKFFSYSLFNFPYFKQRFVRYKTNESLKMSLYIIQPVMEVLFL